MNERILKPSMAEARGLSNPDIGSGLAAIDRSRHNPPSQKQHTGRRGEEDKSKLVCDHCGGRKHTRDTCFHLRGFPNWWEELKRALQQRSGNRCGGGGRAAAAVTVGDRVTYTESPAGDIGTPIAGKNGEEKVVASISAARVQDGGTAAAIWSESGNSQMQNNPNSQILPPSLTIITKPTIEPQKTKYSTLTLENC